MNLFKVYLLEKNCITVFVKHNILKTINSKLKINYKCHKFEFKFVLSTKQTNLKGICPQNHIFETDCYHTQATRHETYLALHLHFFHTPDAGIPKK